MTTSQFHIDTAHSGIHFTVRHMLVSRVRGHFSSYSGVIVIDPKDLTRSTAEVYIQAASIHTGVADRDAHLRSADFLDAERFPEIRFRATRVEPVREGRWRVRGELTLHGVTREIELEVEDGGRVVDPWGQERRGFFARAHLDRGDFGLRWNQALEAGGVLVGERVDVDIEIQAVRTAATRAA